MALSVLAVAVGLLLVPRGRGVPAARVLAVLVLGASAYRVLDHVLVNYESGALDQRYSQSLGHPAGAAAVVVGRDEDRRAPTLAPGVLGQSALLLTSPPPDRPDGASN